MALGQAVLIVLCFSQKCLELTFKVQSWLYHATLDPAVEATRLQHRITEIQYISVFKAYADYPDKNILLYALYCYLLIWKSCPDLS